MNVLAIETAGEGVGVAMADDEGVVASLCVRAGRRHVEVLHPSIESVLRLAGARLSDIDVIAVDVGPGLFTGIRVGIAAAKGFAMALSLPVVGLTSLEILKRACTAAGGYAAVPVVDLRRGEVAWQFGDGEPARGQPAALAEEIRRMAAAKAAPFLLVGDGAIRYAELLVAPDGKSTIAGPEYGAPPVASLAVQAMDAMLAGRAMSPEAVTALYLRDADVRINWSTRHDSPRASEAI